MIFSVVWASLLTVNFVASKVCVNYEVVTSSPSVMSLQQESIGSYKLHYAKTCNGRPTFKHIVNDRYIYVQNGGTWIVGDTKGYTSCTNMAYLYHAYVSAAKSPPRDHGWKYWDFQRKMWRKDEGLELHCICDVIEISSEDLRTLEHQHEIFGRYKMQTDHKCNNRSTYKHVRNNRYLYVDGYDRWVVSNVDELEGKNRARPCTHYSYAYHPAQPSRYVPGKTGWLYKTRDTHEWLNDTSMNAVCLCQSYRVSSTNPVTVSGVKDNLFGVYRLTDGITCNKHPTFKHSFKKLYLYVDNTDDWMISHADDIFGHGRRKTSCDAMGYAYNPKSPAPDVPMRTGWKYYSYKLGIWLDDPHFKVECE